MSSRETPDIPGSVASQALLQPGRLALGEIGFPADQDWYRVQLAGGVAYRFHLDAVGTSEVLDALIAGIALSDGVFLDGSTDDDSGIGTDSELRFVAPVTGTYFVAAAGYESSTGAYALAVMRDALDVPSGTASSAAAGIGTPVLGQVDEIFDIDTFRVALQAGVTYRITMTGNASGPNAPLLDPYIEGIYTTGGRLIAGTTNDDIAPGNLDARVLFTPAAAGTYLVSVGNPFGDLGDYRLLVEALSDLAPGTGTTATLAVGQPQRSSIDEPFDVDAFRVVLAAGASYVFRVTGDPRGPGDPLSDPRILGLLDSTGALIPGTFSDDAVGLDPRLVFAPRVGGTYFLMVDAYADLTGDYLVTMQRRGAASADVPEGNASTATVAVGGSVASEIGGPNDRDTFRVVLERGQRYVIDLTAEGQPALGDPRIVAIHRPNGALLPGSSNDDWGGGFDSRVVLRAPVDGIYRITVGGDEGSTGGYRLGLREEAVSAVDAVGSTPATAAVLSDGSVTGTIDSPYDTDWYRVTLVEGRSYRFDLRGESSGGGTLADPVITGLYDRSGTLIAGTAIGTGGVGTDAQLVFTAPSPGRYFLSAGGYFLDTGSYTLEVTGLGVPGSDADLPADRTTTAVVRPAGVTSDIGTAGDVDWFQLRLQAGQSSVIELRGADTDGGTLQDPLILGIYGANGVALPGTADDDGGVGLDSRVAFTAPSTGTFYVAAASYGSGTGTYTISATRPAVDRTAPTLAASTPADDATRVSPSASLTLRFNEDVQAGEGSIRILGGAAPIVIDVTDTARVRFNGNQVVIDPPADLAANRNYHVRIDAGAIEDRAGNEFAGIADRTTLNFRTGAVPAPGTGDDWTILVYIAADNDLERFAMQDLNEMEAALLPEGVNVVVQVDRTPGYDSTSGNWTDTRRGLITRDANPNVVTSDLESIGERNMGAAASLTEFIDWATATHPADNTMLVLWDHGGGLSGVAWDESSGGDNLTLREMREAIAASDAGRFDVIGFDACLQAMVEQAFELQGLASVLVASQELEPGDGWQHTDWLNRLGLSPTMSAAELGTAIVETYVASTAGQSDITLSAVDLARLGRLEAALDGFVTASLAASAPDRALMTRIIGEMRVYPAQDPGYDYRDLGRFADEVADQAAGAGLRNAARLVADRLDAIVIAEGGTVADATGLTVYLPDGATSGTYTQANYRFLSQVAWDDFLAVV